MVSKANLVQPAYNDLNWNVPLNSNFQILSNAVGGTTNVSVTTTDIVLTSTQAQSTALAFTGTLVGARSVFIPAGTIGTWTVYVGTASNTLSIYVNNGSGAPAGTGLSFPATTSGYYYGIYSDGTNVSFSEGNIVRKTGDTMLGALNLPSNGLNVGSGQLTVTGGNVTTSGQFTAGNNVTAYSDARLKEEIKPISAALAKVMDMRGVTFSYKDTGTRSAGVIAQEVQKSLPEVVYEDENGYLHVAYGNMVSVLIEAIKEMAIKIEALEKRK